MCTIEAPKEFHVDAPPALCRTPIEVNRSFNILKIYGVHGYCFNLTGLHNGRFPIYEEGAALSRRAEPVDECGPPTDFIDIDLLPLREPEVRKGNVGHVFFGCLSTPEDSSSRILCARVMDGAIQYLSNRLIHNNRSK